MYVHIRSEGLLRLPCRSTLQKCIGTVAGEFGFNDLVRCRLEAELENLETPQSKVCGLVVDEMRIQENLIYNKQRDAFVGDVDMGPELQDISPSSEDEVLANSLLCFLQCGLHARFKIPVGYFFTKGCTGEQLAVVIRHVLKKTADVGFDIVRLVTDNHKVNVAAMDILCGGKASIQTSHPADPSTELFLSFDQSHIIKNVRSQFLAKDFGKEKHITSRYVKSLQNAEKLDSEAG
ncbi:hypothetical protein V5799_015386 [Amblyomma americanum]|uniref:Transposable element P transposase-like RNase H domain-containing protein n=1 Tax=Amblyomma americanum TaxID=6943 RepID=A0AAQ4DM98_AMBAM